MKKLIPSISCALVVAFAFTGCETTGDNVLLGAATGAAIGGVATGRGRGALTGAAIGAAGGYLLGKLVQHDRRRMYREGYDEGRDERRYDDDRDYLEERRTRYPVARRTSRPGFVISPYAPYNGIDVRGFPRGAQIEDPSTGRIFINP